MEKRQSESTGRAEQPIQAGLPRRLMSMLYDLPVVIALWMLTTVLAMAFGMENRVAGQDPLYTFSLVLTWFAYLGWSWHRGGMTLGMRAWKLRIESIDGSQPTWSQCLLRFVCAALSWLPAGLGYVWCVFDRQGLCWHDHLSTTRLVQRTEAIRQNA